MQLEQPDCPDRRLAKVPRDGCPFNLHHFYEMLIYFRFPETYYAVTSLAGIALDTVSVIMSALDDKQFATLKKSAAVQDLSHASRVCPFVCRDGQTDR